MSGNGNFKLQLLDALQRDPGNVVTESVVKRSGQIAEVFQNAATAALSGSKLTKEEFLELADQAKNGMQIGAGVANLANGNEKLTTEDKLALAKAVSKDILSRFDPTQIAETFKTMKKAAGVANDIHNLSDSDVNEIVEALNDRAKADAAGALAGSAAVSLVATILKAMPNPGAKATGIGLQAANTAASGSQFSTTIRQLAGAGSPEASAASQQLARIATDKA